MNKTYLIFLFFVIFVNNLTASDHYSKSGELLAYKPNEAKIFKVDVENGVSLCINVEGEKQEVLSAQCLVEFGACLTVKDANSSHSNARKSWGRDVSALIVVYKENDDIAEVKVTNHYLKEKNIRLSTFQDSYKIDVVEEFSPGEVKEYSVRSDEAMHVNISVLKYNEPVEVSCEIVSGSKSNCISLGQQANGPKEPKKWRYSTSGVGIGYTAKEPNEEGLIQFRVISYYPIKKNISIVVQKPRPANWCEIAKWSTDELKVKELKKKQATLKEWNLLDAIMASAFIKNIIIKYLGDG